jgi:YgiT-type zinc finger domain-containing protein
MKSKKQKQSANFTCPADSDCQGTLRVDTREYRFHYHGREIIVPDVTIWVCDRCGEPVFPYESARKIETYKKYSGRLNLRIDPELHAELARRAEQHQRSVNQEAAQLLEAGLDLIPVRTEKGLTRSVTGDARVARRR